MVIKRRKYLFYAEYTRESSNKFWAIIEGEGGMVTCAWGKIGTSGQSQEFDTVTADKRRSDKLRKGYVEDREKMKVLNMGVEEAVKVEKKEKAKEEFFNKIDFLKELGKV